MCIHNPKTTTLTFALGKMVVTGAKSEDDSWLALHKYARISMWLWISGQQTGSLVCTGVGIVFNVFGVGLARVLEGWLAHAWGHAVLHYYYLFCIL